jgi:ribosomal protein S18 acetylase RimI-like enzyme
MFPITFRHRKKPGCAPPWTSRTGRSSSAVRAGEVVAFGGYELSDFYDLGTLVFGLVRADCHGSGIGRALLDYRLLHMAGRKMRPRYVTVDTHPHTAGFFLRCGFEEIARWPGGYRSGRDRVDLRFELSDEAVAASCASGLSGHHDPAAQVAHDAFQRRLHGPVFGRRAGGAAVAEGQAALHQHLVAAARIAGTVEQAAVDHAHCRRQRQDAHAPGQPEAGLVAAVEGRADEVLMPLAFLGQAGDGIADRVPGAVGGRQRARPGQVDEVSLLPDTDML